MKIVTNFTPAPPIKSTSGTKTKKSYDTIDLAHWLGKEGEYLDPLP